MVELSIKTSVKFYEQTTNFDAIAVKFTRNMVEPLKKFSKLISSLLCFVLLFIVVAYQFHYHNHPQSLSRKPEYTLYSVPSIDRL